MYQASWTAYEVTGGVSNLSKTESLHASRCSNATSHVMQQQELVRNFVYCMLIRIGSLALVVRGGPVSSVELELAESQWQVMCGTCTKLGEKIKNQYCCFASQAAVSGEGQDTLGLLWRPLPITVWVLGQQLNGGFMGILLMQLHLLAFPEMRSCACVQIDFPHCEQGKGC